jgi:hypothetical protein
MSRCPAPRPELLETILFNGPVTLKTLGAAQNRLDLNLSEFKRSEIRTVGLEVLCRAPR